MRILYSHYLAEEDHAAVRMVHQISRELTQRGHEVRVHRSAGPVRSGAGSARPRQRSRWTGWLRGGVNLARTLARNLSMKRRDQAALASFRPDLVLARQDAYCWSMTAACQSASIPLVTYADAPVALETRLFSPPGRWHPPGLVEAVERWNLTRSQAIITVSRPAASTLAHYGLSVPIHVVPNGVDLQQLAVSAQETQELRTRLGFGDRCVIGFLGTFRAFHGLETLRRIMTATAQRKDVHWLLVGDGPGRGDLQQAAAGSRQVTFLGHQPGEMVGKLLSVMDIALVPQSRVEGAYYFCPLKVLECAGAGCAVVAGNQGDVPWLLDEGKAGVLLPPDDAPAWIAAVERLIGDPAGRQRLGARASQRIREQFTWQQTATKVEVILQQILDRGRR
ncbi:MAG: glycosyltransferase family 4 protein [Gemmataceae bacterium]